MSELEQLIKQLIELLQEHKEVMINNNQLLREYRDMLKKVEPTRE